jgi:hypothetical protein
MELLLVKRLRNANDESGAILVFSAIALVALLGISALVIDIGYGHVEQRKLQNGGDAAALGAAQDLPNLSGSTATAVTDAENIAGQNLPNNTLNWTTASLCTGAALSKPSSSPCISFNSTFNQIRVWIPRQTFSTLFGGILGFRSITTRKVATAQVNIVGNGSGLEPFMMPNAFGAGAFCLDSGGNGNSTFPCTGGVTGNFGLLSFASCSGLNYGLDDTVAAGADHFYSTENPQNPANDIPDDCTVPGPNTVGPAPGNKKGQETPPMTGSGPFADGGPGRLQRSPSDTADFTNAWEVTSNGLDNRPLWEFIPSTISGTSYPAECTRATFTSLLAATPVAQQQDTMNWALDRCIFEYTCGHLDTTTSAASLASFVGTNPAGGPDACTGTSRVGAGIPQCGNAQCRSPIFNFRSPSAPQASGISVDDIVFSPRFVYVPEMWQTTEIGGNSGVYEIEGFRPVFIQGNGKNNGTRFEPGPWNTGNAETTAADITSFVFPPAVSSCTISATDSCGTMLGGTLGLGQVNIGSNAVVQLIG